MSVRTVGGQGSIPLRRAEALRAALAGGALAVAMTWPLTLHLGSRVRENLADPLLQAWQIAWGGHALLSQPGHFFDANAFWPLHHSLAFSDGLLGYAPVGLLGEGPHAALVRYNLLFLFAYALAFLGLYLLARELGVRSSAAMLAGAAFAYAPWRLSQSGHLHVLSSGGIPLTLFLLLRGYRRQRTGMVIAGWLMAAWQVSLGFTLGLPLLYLLGLLGCLWLIGWVRDGRPAPARGLVVVTVAGAVLLLAWSGFQARPYLQVVDEHPEARRTQQEVKFYSPPPKGLLAAPGGNLVWGALGRRLVGNEPVTQDQSLFPGLALLALAVAGVGGALYSRRLKIGLVAGVAITAVLSLGLRLGSLSPYGLLYELAPGWQGIRTPGRLTTMTLLALTLLAAAGAHRLLVVAGRRGRTVAGAASLVMLAAILLEGAGSVALRRVPGPPPGLVAARSPVLELPSAPYTDPLVMLWSTDGFPALVNGYSGFTPSSLTRTLRSASTFPDASSVRALRRLGVRTVIVHPFFDLRALATDTPQKATAVPQADSAQERWRETAGRDAPPGLRVSRRLAGGVALFDLRPTPPPRR